MGMKSTNHREPELRDKLFHVKRRHYSGSLNCARRTKCTYSLHIRELMSENLDYSENIKRWVGIA
jgi:hypothetical protein